MPGRNKLFTGTIFLIFLCLLMVSPVNGDDFIYFIGRDFHNLLSSDPLISLGAGGICTAGAFLLEDGDGYSGFMGDGFFHDCSEVCDRAFGLPLLGGASLLWAGGAIFGSNDTEETGQILTEGLLVTHGITGILKLGTGRERPDGSNSRSFPSGHVSGTVCSTVILWDRLGPEAGIPAAVIAGFTAFSRITLGKHYPSDVIAGAAIGLATGLAVTKAHNDDSPNTPRVQPALMLYWNSDEGFGVYF